MEKKILKSFIACVVLALWSCSTPKDITYMQGFNDLASQEVTMPSRITVQPDDKISIIVTSKDPALAEVFNLAIAQYRIGTTQGYTSESKVGSFTVDPSGNIDYPLLGSLHLSGMTRHEVADMVKHRIITANLLKDPIVTVEFLNASVSVLGDVNKPGEYPIDRDDMTILQAIAKAGDLQITGMRNNVLVVREEDGRDVAYRIDLTNTASIMESPVYYLRQNDVVYVEPNNTRKRQATANGNTALNPSFWLSFISVVTTVCVLIFK